MVSKWGVVLLCALGLTTAQNGYSRDNPANQLSYDSFNQGYSDNGNGDEINGDEIPGEAGRDYPIYSEVPQTGFNCQNQQAPGYYADPEAQCQAFYICQKGGKSDGFLCPNGTVFNQQYLVCDWWYNFDCSQAEEFYSVNEQIVQAMQEADARLSQQQEGYNYDGPEGIRNGGDHSGRYTGPQPGGLQDPSAVYGVPSRNGNGKNNANLNGRRNENGNGNFNGKIGSPRPIYGVPPSGNGVSGPTSQYSSSNGKGPSSEYNTEINNGFNGNGNDNSRLENFNGNDSPKPVYGVPSSGNGVSGPAQFNAGNSNGNNFNGNHRGQESLNGNGLSSRYNGNTNGFSGNGFPKPVYGVPSTGNGVSGPAQFSSGSANGNNFNGNHRGQESLNGNGPSSRYNAGNTNAFSGNVSLKPVYGVPSSGNDFSGPAAQYNTIGVHSNGFNGNRNSKLEDLSGNGGAPKPVYGVPSSGVGSSGPGNGGNSNGFNGNGNKNLRIEDLSGNIDSPKPVYGVPSSGNSGPGAVFNGNGNRNSRLEDLNGNGDSPNTAYGVPSSDNSNNGGNGFNLNQNGNSEFAESFNGNQNSGFNGNSGNGPERSYLPPSGNSQDYNGSSRGLSGGDDHSADFNGNVPDRSYLPSKK